MKLKTLKDLEKDYGHSGVHFYGYDKDKVKKEAIKWIAERIVLCMECASRTKSHLIPCEEHKFWMDRFNITEEEIKNDKS